MASTLNNAAVVKNDNVVCSAYAREPVRNQYRHPAGGMCLKPLKDPGFSPGVEHGSRLVKNQNIGVAPHIRTR